MSLDNKIIELIMKDGSYYKKDFKEETKEVLITENIKSWFFENLGIKNKKSDFISFYTLVASPPLGKSVLLSPLDEIEEDENFTEEYILLGNDELGSILYDKNTDEVFEFDIDIDLENIDINLAISKWKSFKEFLEEFYINKTDRKRMTI